MNDKVAILCVLKSGGDFVPSDVGKLKIMLGKSVTVPYEFYCLTDVHGMDNCVKTLPLLNNYPGWWSKVELFRNDLVASDRVVYFDLDTIIRSNIDDLVVREEDFIGLRPFNPTRSKWNGYVASAIMSWKNDNSFDFIFRDFIYPQHSTDFRGDQDYLSEKLAEKDLEFFYWQDLVDGIYSYKRHVRKYGLHNARIVCFHGSPRPYNVDAVWIREAIA